MMINTKRTAYFHFSDLLQKIWVLDGACITVNISEGEMITYALKYIHYPPYENAVKRILDCKRDANKIIKEYQNTIVIDKKEFRDNVLLP